MPLNLMSLKKTKNKIETKFIRKETKVKVLLIKINENEGRGINGALLRLKHKTAAKRGVSCLHAP